MRVEEIVWFPCDIKQRLLGEKRKVTSQPTIQLCHNNAYKILCAPKGKKGQINNLEAIRLPSAGGNRSVN